MNKELKQSDVVIPNTGTTLTRICNVHLSSRTNSALSYRIQTHTLRHSSVVCFVSQRERNKDVKNLFSYCLNALLPKRKLAFTLPEVLITLGIIGVVAALTIPGLNQTYKNQAAATKLQKFYSTMNQVIRMAENDYGDKKDWLDDHHGCDYILPSLVEYDMNGNPVIGESQTEKFFNKFFAPYLKISHVKHLSNGSFVVYFPDGSALSPGPDYPTTKCYNWMYFPGNSDRCGYTNNTFADPQGGRCRFSFTLRLGLKEKQQPFGFQPFYYDNELPSRAKLRSDCSNYGFSCAALIKYDGWRVAPDYPSNRKIRF